MDTQKLFEKILNRVDLTVRESEFVLGQMFEGNLTPVQLSGFLTGLRTKGESIDELVGFIQGMRTHMFKIPRFKNAIDTCGTGGDASGTFNISTTVAFVVAGAGVVVAKHGNRSASSTCGSADVLEALGVNISLDAFQATAVLKKTGMVFLFAPLYHPAMKHVGLVRRELKTRTIFNFLGPFANPAQVKRQIIGVPNFEIAAKLSEVAKHLNYDHLLIVTSEDGLDEVSIFAKTHVFEIKKKAVKEFEIDPKKHGFTSLKRKNIAGGDAQKNATIIHTVLSGEKGDARDIVVLNAACALYVAGKVLSIQKGIKVAEESINSGKAKNILESLIKKV